MGGIVFFRTENRAEVVAFYRDRVGATTWLEQDGCTILRYENQLLGFCDADHTETAGIVTFYYDDRATVDDRYEALSDVADDPPRVNDRYDIYQFFAEDPDGRTVEFQQFLHPVEDVV